MNDAIMDHMRSAVFHARNFPVRRVLILREMDGRDDCRDPPQVSIK